MRSLTVKEVEVMTNAQFEEVLDSIKGRDRIKLIDENGEHSSYLITKEYYDELQLATEALKAELKDAENRP